MKLLNTPLEPMFLSKRTSTEFNELHSLKDAARLLIDYKLSHETPLICNKTFLYLGETEVLIKEEIEKIANDNHVLSI